MYSLLLLIVAALVSLAAGVQLVIEPSCGALFGTVSDLNAGLGSLSSYSTIVAFGDGYTDGGKEDGSTLAAAVQDLPNPKAGGRLSNGPVWVENLATDINATLKDYAVTATVVDHTQYPAYVFSDTRDFVYQNNYVISGRNKPTSDDTLYIVFVGMEDFLRADASSFPNTANNVIYELLLMTDSPLFAKNILVVDNYGRGNVTSYGNEYKQTVFDGLGTLYSKRGAKVGFVDLGNLWAAILGTNPGYEAFGYVSTGACTVNDTTTEGQCDNPDETFYYIPNYPSAVTHRLMADYIEAVFEQCQWS
ncbi:carbohydrate esterase family 16 protein [Armillaria luteobubalina]|uniref:Carbohydrate esterase family 16 protein n=1 Tax=Armillaria luteobubalina TaxID=153913 RepID=A0AA39QM00_9AGAR|nr:carbohydrate esterase family 16 protein [Armillaria luteobubalina]